MSKNRVNSIKSSRPRKYASVGILLMVILVLIIPKPKLLDNYTYSSAFYDAKGRLLRLSLSMDDKYRLFVPLEKIPNNAKKALLLYEDKNFYYHPGFNPLSLARAGYDMFQGGRKQGASTITMQLARIIYNIDSTTALGKIEQILRAIQLEMFYSKDEILEGYFNLSPYGGNVEGIGAAGLVYFNTKPEELNLKQIIALTVVPQNPGKRNLSTVKGKHEAETASERLKEMWLNEYDMKDNSYLNLPLQTGRYLPFHAPHFIRQVSDANYGEVYTTLDLDIQKILEDTIHQYVSDHQSQGVYNAAGLIVNYKTMNVVAQVGSNDFFNNQIEGQVDGTKAQRSPGSSLKPFIYALAMDQGIIHPLTMLQDVPRNYNAYTPENFDRSFYGMTSATDALINSRNVPAVDLMQKLQNDAFYKMLKTSGVKNLKSSQFYGLALALGGFEISPQEIAKLYAMLGNLGELKDLNYTQFSPPLISGEGQGGVSNNPHPLSQEASYLTLYMLNQNNPTDENNIPFVKKKKRYPVYWKTGTSYGFKDAITAGIVGDYVIVIWVGNFDGTPNNVFVGRKIAAPLFFRVVRKLEKSNDFYKPRFNPQSMNLAKVDICKPTGDIANAYCQKIIKSYFIPGVSSIKMSNVSRLIPIDVKTGLRACRHRPPQTKLVVYDFWPTNVIKAYAMSGINLKNPPAFKENCGIIEGVNKGKPPLISYPLSNASYLVRSNNLEHEKIALKASTDSDADEIYWFFNNTLVGQSKPEETIETKAIIGDIEIKAVDNLGRYSTSNISVKLAD